MLLLCTVGQAVAQDASTVEPRVEEVLRQMSELLAKSTSFAFKAEEIVDEGKDTARKVAGGAGLGAVIGAIGAAVGAGVGTAASAATEGQQVVLDEGTVTPFKLTEALSVPIAVTVTTADAATPQ